GRGVDVTVDIDLDGYRDLEIIKTAPRTVTCKAFGESLPISRIVVGAVEHRQPTVGDFGRPGDVLGSFGGQEYRGNGAEWVDGRRTGRRSWVVRRRGVSGYRCARGGWSNAMPYPNRCRPDAEVERIHHHIQASRAPSPCAIWRCIRESWQGAVDTAGRTSLRR